jgi:hypothetical protein
VCVCVRVCACVCVCVRVFMCGVLASVIDTVCVEGAAGLDPQLLLVKVEWSGSHSDSGDFSSGASQRG